MADPSYRYSVRLADQPADSAGRRWFLKELVDASDGGPDLRAELLARALFSSGGIVLRPTLGLVGSIATITGPVLGITEDGLAPLLVDQAAAGVDLDLDALGSAFADGSHAIVLRAAPVLEAQAFTTPAVSVRDPQGSVVSTIEGESVSYQTLVAYGELDLIEGTTPSSTELVIATVSKAGASWTTLAEAGAEPILRALDARLVDAADTFAVGTEHAGALVLVTDDALVQLGESVRRGLQLVVANDSDVADVILTPTGAATLIAKTTTYAISPRGAVTIVSLGAGAWRAYGDWVDATGSGS